ncbi:uncharacterized protein LOC125226244 [Leguminivora glycinivorella]|uniref:uncharacterized protein LOC125226244 n=1 Tax=Leguminivora glycinivorella TaxID=1035111 RepID=UPI0020104873|nr:uncharacterized protein LOC125226244 [Leguminivora glycinivorella]
MLKITVIFGVLLTVFVVGSTSQRIILPTYRPPLRPPFRPDIILPTYRPPRQGPVIRYARAADDIKPSETDTHNLASINNVPSSDENIPHTYLYQDQESNQRIARSLDSPGAKRGGGSSRTSSGSRDTGRTHPGYNRRNARDIKLLDFTIVIDQSQYFHVQAFLNLLHVLRY